MTTSKRVWSAVATMVAERGVNESGELPDGWAREIATELDVPCDEAVVQYASEAYAHAATALERCKAHDDCAVCDALAIACAAASR